MKQNGIEPISLRRSSTFRISNQRAMQDTELDPRLLSANRTTVSRTQTSNLLSPLLNISIKINYSFANYYHHYLIFQLQLITPLQITYGYDVTQAPCSIVTLKQATYSQSKGRC
jgi:hypothetical protein